MKSQSEFLKLVYDKANAQTALQKSKRRRVSLLLCSFAFVLICGAAAYRLLPTVNNATVFSADSDAAESLRQAFALSDGTAGEGASAVPYDVDFAPEISYQSHPEAEAAEEAAEDKSIADVKMASAANRSAAAEVLSDALTAPYVVEAYFTDPPTVYGYTVDYTDTEIKITVYTDRLPADAGSFRFALPVYLDEEKQNQLPVRTKFVLES